MVRAPKEKTGGRPYRRPGLVFFFFLFFLWGRWEGGWVGGRVGGSVVLFFGGGSFFWRGITSGGGLAEAEPEDS